MNWAFLLIARAIAISCARIIPANHYKGCFGTDLLVHKVPQYQPSRGCWRHCEFQSASGAVSVVGGRWCGCSKTSGLHPGSFHCQVHCTVIPQHQCECYEGNFDDYDEVALSRAFDYMEHLPKPNEMLGYNCHDVPLNFYYEKYPSSALDRENECLTLCNAIPRKFGSLLIVYKCGCKRTDDPDDDVLLPITKSCADQMVCMEIKTSVCLCGDNEIDPRTYSSVKAEGPLLNSDKFRCYFMTTTDAVAMKKRRPDFQPMSAMTMRPEDCITLCSKKESTLASLHAGGLCSCHEEIQTGQFDEADCKEPCQIDSQMQGCGGKYSASVYSSVELKGQITEEELDNLFDEGVVGSKMVQPNGEPSKPELQGCYAIDYLVHKSEHYRPTDECWKKCEKKGIKHIAVAGGRWCGCPSNGVMGAGTGNCFIYCSFIPDPKCECFGESPDTYDGFAVKLASKFIEELPLPHKLKGYDCHSQPLPIYKHIYPGAANMRAYECFTATCKGFNRNLGAYLAGFRCGCKKSDNPLDDTLLPVTKDCVDRMICIELTMSVCLCGDDKIDPMTYSPATRVGPLLNSDKFQCWQMQQNTPDARKLRRSEYKDVWKHDVTPIQCINSCFEAEYAFAGVFQGQMCACQNYPGVRRVGDLDCSIGCPGNDIPHGCGGPYTASVYHTKNSIELSVDAMVNLLQSDVKAIVGADKVEGPAATTQSVLQIEEELSKIKLKGEIQGRTQEDIEKTGTDGEMKGVVFAVIFSILSSITVLAVIAIYIIWRRRIRPVTEDGSAPEEPSDEAGMSGVKEPSDEVDLPGSEESPEKSSYDTSLINLNVRETPDNEVSSDDSGPSNDDTQSGY